MATPVHLFSGFLGAGKTTAIRAQLAAHTGEKIAVIVNDFGEASLDEATLADEAPFQITNIPGGCVCCTAPEGFVAALGAVLKQRPDRLIIEPTGLARPQDLIDTIRRCPHRDQLEIAPVVVLVDPRQLELLEKQSDPESAALLAEQAQVADILVANHTDLCTPLQLEGFRRFAEKLWPEPLAIYQTTRGEIPKGALAWPPGDGARAERRSETPQHPHEHSTAHHRARSFRYGPDVVFSRARLENRLQRALAGEAGAAVARMKGRRTDQRFLVEDHTLTVAPSLGVYLTASVRARQGAGRATGRVLAVGNPTIDRALGLPDAPGANTEAAAVAEIFPGAALLTDAAATRERFLTHLGEAGIVHFAGHAVTSDAHSLSSYLALAPEGDDRGVVSESDLRGLRLDKTALVILSACSSASGRWLETEGATGLARAFLSAGVPSVIASLWDVEDEPAIELWVHFHRRIAEGASPSQALTEAKRRALDPASGAASPWTWAAFDVYGGM